MRGSTNSLSLSLSRFSKTVMAALPFWALALIIGFVPVRALEIIDYFVAHAVLSASILGASMIFSLLIIYFLYSMRFITKRINRLSDYARKMSPEQTTADLSIRYRLQWVLVIWLVLLGINALLFGVPDDFKGIFAEDIPLFAYFFFIFASFLWLYCYSMLEIYTAGKLPLQLTPFTEDRALGLKPFGTTSLKLVSVYAVFPIVVTVLGQINIILDAPGGMTVQLAPLRASDIIFVTGLVLVGIGLFFLPLLSIHRRLREAKRNELGWVNSQYTTIVRKLKELMAPGRGDEHRDERRALADDLTMVRQLQSDVLRIQAWPFDLGVITRLGTLLVLPPFLGVFARILILTFLHI